MLVCVVDAGHDGRKLDIDEVWNLGLSHHILDLLNGQLAVCDAFEDLTAPQQQLLDCTAKLILGARVRKLLSLNFFLMVPRPRFRRLQFDLSSLVLGDILDFIREANLQLPVAKQSKLTEGRDALRLDALGLLEHFILQGPVEGHPLTPGDVDCDRSCEFKIIFHLVRVDLIEILEVLEVVCLFFYQE